MGVVRTWAAILTEAAFQMAERILFCNGRGSGPVLKTNKDSGRRITKLETGIPYPVGIKTK